MRRNAASGSKLLGWVTLFLSSIILEVGLSSRWVLLGLCIARSWDLFRLKSLVVILSLFWDSHGRTFLAE